MPQRKSKETFLSEVMIASPNVDLLEDYTSSTTPLLCRCKKCGHEWKGHPRSLLRGINCPECGFRLGGGKVNRRTHTEFIEELSAISPSIEVLGTYKNAQTKILCRCKTCGYSWETTPNSLLRGSGCQKCAGLYPWTTEGFKEKISTINSSIIVLGEYKNNRTKIKCKCATCSFEWDANPSNLLSGHGCPRCGDVLTKTNEQFIQEAQKGINPNVELLGKYVTAKTPIKCRCKVCGYEYETLPANIIKGFGCAKCAGSAKKTKDEFETQLAMIDPTVIVLDEYINHFTKLRCRCTRCGNEWLSTPANLLAGHGCQRCSRASTSFMEQYVLSALSLVLGKDNMLSRDKATIGMEVDIISPTYKIAVEIGAWYWHKNRISRDIEKQKLCNSKGIRLFSVYDSCGYDSIPKFDDCLHYSYSLAAEENYITLKQIVETLIDASNHSHCFSESEWNAIEKEARAFSKRKGIDEYRDELLVISPQIEIIGDHIQTGRRVKCRCKKCGYEWNAYLSNLLRGTQCRRCAGLLRKTQEQFIEEVCQANNRLEVIGEYVNDNTPVKCKCVFCGYVWDAHPRNILRGSACPKCKGTRISTKVRRKTNEQFLEQVRHANNRLEVIGEYVNDNTPVKCKCVFCGYTWDARPRNILRGRACPKCKGERISASKRKTTEQFIEEMASVSPNIEVIGNYIDCRTMIRCRCRTCGFEWEQAPTNLLSKQRHYCKNCHTEF